MTEQEIRSAFAGYVHAGIFKPVLRHLKPEIAEDRMAEGLGLVFELFRSKALKGEVMDPELLVHAVRLRACDLSRNLVRGGQKIKDPLDPRTYQLGRVQLLHLDGVAQEGETPYTADIELEAVATEGLSTDPASWIHSALDLESWLGSLKKEDRKMLGLRQAGHTLAEIGLLIGRSFSYVCNRLKILGRDLAERAGVGINEKKASGDLVPA